MGNSLEQLRAFHHVARLGSMTAAADALFVTQPAVSHAVALLEQRLGSKLFVRAGRGLALTAEGKALYRTTVEVAAALGRGQASLDALRAMQSGSIEFTAPFLLLHTFLLPHVQAFHRKFPQVRFRIHVENRREPLLEASASAEQDFVCMATPTLDVFPESVAVEAVARYRICLMANRAMYGELEGRELSFSQANRHPLIVLTRGNSTRDIFEEAFSGAGLAPNIAFEGETMALVEDFTRAGFGLGVLIRREPRMKGEFPAELFEVRTARPLPGGSYVVAHRAGRELSDAAQAFVNGIRRAEGG